LSDVKGGEKERMGSDPFKKKNQLLKGVQALKEEFNPLNWEWGQTPGKKGLDISLRVNCKLRISLAQE